MMRKATLVLCGFLVVLSLVSSLVSSLVIEGQEASSQSAPAEAAGRALGTVTVVKGQTITMKTDAGAELSITVSDTTRLLQLKPGEKDLKAAAPLGLADLKAGDRILVRGAASADGKSLQASSVIAMKQTDIADKQAHERAEWQQHSVGGLVKSVDATGGVISITTNGSGTPKDVAVKTTKQTILRRYAANSVKFDDAKPASITELKAGDQLRARGQKNADGNEFAADEIVSGTFRSIAGILVSTDSAAGTITVTDLATKQPVTLRITSDSQLRKLQPFVAQRIAMRLKGTPAGGAPGPNAASAAGPGAPSAPKPAQGSAPGSAAPRANGPGANGAGMGPGEPGSNGQARAGDLQQMIAHMPAGSLSDLVKGDALMIVATEGSTSSPSTIITLLAGVEPILQASSKATQDMILSPWSLGGGGGEGATP
jgi:Domain of unknown function (DUF5666)